MTILYFYGWISIPGGVKATYLTMLGHTVITPLLNS